MKLYKRIFEIILSSTLITSGLSLTGCEKVGKNIESNNNNDNNRINIGYTDTITEITEQNSTVSSVTTSTVSTTTTSTTTIYNTDIIDSNSNSVDKTTYNTVQVEQDKNTIVDTVETNNNYVNEVPVTSKNTSTTTITETTTNNTITTQVPEEIVNTDIENSMYYLYYEDTNGNAANIVYGTVLTGESVKGVATRFGEDINNICDLNNLDYDYIFSNDTDIILHKFELGVCSFENANGKFNLHAGYVLPGEKIAGASGFAGSFAHVLSLQYKGENNYVYYYLLSGNGRTYDKYLIASNVDDIGYFEDNTNNIYNQIPIVYLNDDSAIDANYDIYYDVNMNKYISYNNVCYEEPIFSTSKTKVVRFNVK